MAPLSPTVRPLKKRKLQVNNECPTISSGSTLKSSHLLRPADNKLHLMIFCNTLHVMLSALVCTYL
jgi:hypothetical protein